MYVCLYLIFYIYFGMTPNLLTLSVPNHCNFAKLLRQRKRREISNYSEYSLSACRRILIKYAPPLSEVVYRPLEVAVGALKKAHIYVLKKNEEKIRK